MIIHATRKLAARLVIDRRQCVLFCHDATRSALFVPGLRKELFADLGARSLRPLFSATLAAMGCPPSQVAQA
jgi:hypothetical protein